MEEPIHRPGPSTAGTVALLFTSRWLEPPVIESLTAAGMSAGRHPDASALVGALHQTRVDLVLIEDAGNHFLHSMTTLRFRGTSSVPVVAVGRGASHEISRALQQGAADYAVLGESMQLLVHRVQARLMIERQAKAPSALRVGACWLEASSHLLQFNGGEVSLTPREFALAWVLFEHAGQAVSVQALSQQVWGRQAEVSKRTIEQHVSRLRAKLATAGAEDDPQVSLQAIHNVGYRLLALRRHGARTPRTVGREAHSALTD